jgi:hypothetical protein
VPALATPMHSESIEVPAPCHIPRTVGEEPSRAAPTGRIEEGQTTGATAATTESEPIPGARPALASWARLAARRAIRSRPGPVRAVVEALPVSSRVAATGIRSWTELAIWAREPNGRRCLLWTTSPNGRCGSPPATSTGFEAASFIHNHQIAAALRVSAGKGWRHANSCVSPSALFK